MDLTDIATRLGTATLIGGLIGLDRFTHRKTIGVRTLGLVALGSAALVTASTIAGEMSDPASVSRVIQGLVAGIGFLGAGVIMHAQVTNKVHGLTTAATVWIAAIVGIVCGLGVWPVAVLMSALIAVVLFAGGRLEKWLVHRIETDDEAGKPPQ